MFKSITYLNLNESTNFSLNASVTLLGQMISKAPKLSFIDIGMQEKHLIDIFYPAEYYQDLRLKSRGETYIDEYGEEYTPADSPILKGNYPAITLPEGHGEFSIVKIGEEGDEGEDFDFSTAKE